MKNTFIRSLEAEKRKEVKAMIDKVIELRKQEREIFDVNIVRQITNIIKTGDEVKKNRLPVEHFLEANDSFSKYLDDLYACIKKDDAECLRKLK
jgi:hypothetical protein